MLSNDSVCNLLQMEKLAVTILTVTNSPARHRTIISLAWHVLTPITLAKLCALEPSLVAVTILFQAARFPTIASFLNSSLLSLLLLLHRLTLTAS